MSESVLDLEAIKDRHSVPAKKWGPGGVVSREWLAQNEVLELVAEVERLRQAIRDAGFAIMRTSGGLSIHDVSDKAKADEERTTQVISENIDLREELRSLVERVEMAGWHRSETEAARGLLLRGDKSE